MIFKIPKNTKDTFWTLHSIAKMKEYGLSEQRVRRVLKSPQRIEEGIAPNTIAYMQLANPTAKNKTEIWVMVQNKKSVRYIVSAWRYPGISPKGKFPEIPDDVWEEINGIL